MLARERWLQTFRPMVAILLFVAIIVVGGLGMVAMVSELRKQARSRRDARARVALREAQRDEARRLEKEHASLLARTPAPPRVAQPRKVEPVAAEPRVSLTSLFQLLERADAVELPRAPQPSPRPGAPAPPRLAKGTSPRFAKGTGPPPIPAGAPVLPPRALPARVLPPQPALAPRALPPPIPKLALRSPNVSARPPGLGQVRARTNSAS